MNRRRIAITGIGMVTPVGNDAPTTWANLLAGRSGIGPIRNFDASGFPTRIGAEVKDFDASKQSSATASCSSSLALASVRARGRRGGACATPAFVPQPSTQRSLGLAASAPA